MKYAPIIAAVSALRVVLPREMISKPDDFDISISSKVHPPSGPTKAVISSWLLVTSLKEFISIPDMSKNKFEPSLLTVLIASSNLITAFSRWMKSPDLRAWLI